MVHFCLIAASITVKTLPWATSHSPRGSCLSEPSLKVSSHQRWWPLWASGCSSANWDAHSICSSGLWLGSKDMCLWGAHTPGMWSHGSSSCCSPPVFRLPTVCCVTVPFSVGHLFSVFSYCRWRYSNISASSGYISKGRTAESGLCILQLGIDASCSSQRVNQFPLTQQGTPWYISSPPPHCGLGTFLILKQLCEPFWKCVLSLLSKYPFYSSYQELFLTAQ